MKKKIDVVFDEQWDDYVIIKEYREEAVHLCDLILCAGWANKLFGVTDLSACITVSDEDFEGALRLYMAHHGHYFIETDRHSCQYTYTYLYTPAQRILNNECVTDMNGYRGTTMYYVTVEGTDE